MAVFSLISTQNIPGTPDKIWSFFADPANLPMITPPYMQFRILPPPGAASSVPQINAGQIPASQIYAGQIIEYKLRPLPWLSTYWMTEITQVREGQYFVDEQRHGPYRLWHHQHHFKPIQNGVEMTDIVHYAIPYGIIGDFANALFVRKQLQEIFQYRYRQVESIFGVYAPRS